MSRLLSLFVRPDERVTVSLAEIAAARRPSAERPLKRGYNGKFIRPYRVPTRASH